MTWKVTNWRQLVWFLPRLLVGSLGLFFLICTAPPAMCVVWIQMLQRKMNKWTRQG